MPTTCEVLLAYIEILSESTGSGPYAGHMMLCPSVYHLTGEEVKVKAHGQSEEDKKGSDNN